MFLKHYNAIFIKSSDLISTIIEHFENTLHSFYLYVQTFYVI